MGTTEKHGVTHWNYRIIKKNWQDRGSITYHIHEVYYTDGFPDAWSVEPMAAYGEDLMWLHTDLKQMLQAFDKPVLIEVDDNNQIKLVEPTLCPASEEMQAEMRER